MVGYVPELVGTLRSYGDLHWFIMSGYRRTSRRKQLENNSYARFDPDDHCAIVIDLHNNDIMRLYHNGDVFFDTCSWATMTTKNRFNDYSPVGFSFIQDGGLWNVSWPGGSRRIFQRSAYFRKLKDGTYEGIFSCVSPGDKNSVKILRRQISVYCHEYVKTFLAGEIDNTKRCVFCEGRTSDTAHLVEHIENREFIPALIIKTIETFRQPHADMKLVMEKLNGSKDEIGGLVAYKTEFIETLMQKYILKQFNLPF